MFENLKQAYLPDTEFPLRHVDETKCTKCGRCYEACPTYGYTWRKGDLPIPRGYGGFVQACLNCGNCMAVCPTGAITMKGSYSVHSGRYKNMLLGQMRCPNPLGLEEQKEYKDFESELTEVERTVYNRRSNRLFKDKAVPEDIIKRVLEAGRFAPSAGNCQPYKFIVITKQDVVRELEALAMKSLRVFKNLYLDKRGKRRFWKNALFSIASWMMVNKVDPRPITAMEKADNRDDKIHFGAPALIMVLKDKRGVSNPDLDAGICAQNMVLVAHSLGLGTCFVSLPITPLASPLMAGFRKKIGITYPYEAVTAIALGYPKGKIDGIVKRDTPPVEWI